MMSPILMSHPLGRKLGIPQRPHRLIRRRRRLGHNLYRSPTITKDLASHNLDLFNEGVDTSSSHSFPLLVEGFAVFEGHGFGLVFVGRAEKVFAAFVAGDDAGGLLAGIGGDAFTTGGSGGGGDAAAGGGKVEGVFAADSGRLGFGGVGDEGAHCAGSGGCLFGLIVWVRLGLGLGLELGDVGDGDGDDGMLGVFDKP